MAQIKKGCGRLLAVALAAVLALGGLPTTALAQDPAGAGGAQNGANLVTGDGYSFDKDTGALSITNQNGFAGWQKNTAINLLTVKSVDVTGVDTVADEAFIGCTNLIEATLGDGVVTIGKSAFENCPALERLDLPEGLVEIGRRAFFGDKYLRIFPVPDSLKTIREQAFLGCLRLDLRLPDGIETIASGAFSDCTTLSLAKLPAALTAIGDATFSGCSSLTLTELPGGITSIGSEAFKDCTSLRWLELPAGVTFIGINAFRGCSKLTVLTFLGSKAPRLYNPQLYPPFGGVEENGVLRYAAGADYSQIKSSLPEAWTSEELDASSVKGVAVSPDGFSVQKGTKLGLAATVDGPALGVTWSVSPAAGGSTISGNGLLSVAAGETAESLLVTATSTLNPTVSGSATVMVVDDPVTYSVSGTIIDRSSWQRLEGVAATIWQDGRKVAEALTDAQGAYLCAGLPRGDYVVKAGGYASNGTYYKEQTAPFSLVDKDKEVDFDPLPGEPPKEILGTFEYGSLRYDIISENPNEVSVRGWIGTSLDTLDIPDTVYNGGAFYTVVRIGDEAFYDDQTISKLSLPETLREVGEGAFFNATGLGAHTDELVIPAGVTSVGNQAFCSTSYPRLSLAENGRLATIGDEAFAYGFFKEDVRIPASVTHIGVGAFQTNPIRGVSFAEGSRLSSIGNFAFFDSDIEGTLVVPAGVTYIGDLAFASTALTGLVLPDSGSLSIGDMAFGRDQDKGPGILGELKIPASVTHIGDQAFSEAGITSVDFSAFSGTLGKFVFDGASVSELTFGQSPAPSYDVKSFERMSSSGTVRYPQSAPGYDPDDFAGGALKSWTFAPRTGGATAPAMPSALSAYLNGADVHLSWRAPSNGGSPITGYELSRDGFKNVYTTTESTEFIFVGLNAGTLYTFSVRAKNAVGAGTAASVTMRTYGGQVDLPSAPRNLAAEPGDGQMTLTWEYPENDGGANIAKFEASWDDGATWYDASSLSTHTFTGLQNGTSYTFKVRAVNSAGAGSAASVKAVPQEVLAEEFVADGLLYRVTSKKPNEAILLGSMGSFPETISVPAVVQDENGGSDRFSVVAIKDNAFYGVFDLMTLDLSQATNLRLVGTSAFDGSGLEGTLVLPASVETIRSGAFANTALTSVDFSAFSGSLGDGVFEGSPVAELTFGRNPAPTYNSSSFAGVASTGVVRYPHGAVGYVPETFAGGALSDWTFEAYALAPGAPRNLTATPGNAQIALAWEAPADDGGSALTGYQVSVDRGVTWEDLPADALSHTLSGLVNGTTYNVLVRAVNAVGTSAGAGAQATPEAPRFKLTVEDGIDVTNAGPYPEGAQVVIRANQPKPSEEFNLWMAFDQDDVVFADEASPETTVIMPAHDTKVTATVRTANLPPYLWGIADPAPVTGVANGTALDEISLPATVAITTSKGDRRAAVTWDLSTASPAYDPASAQAQTFAIKGAVTLPDDVENPRSIALEATVSVTVEEAEADVLTGLAIASEPGKVSYFESEALDLTGLSVTLTYSVSGEKTVPFGEFADNGVTTQPAHGTALAPGNDAVVVSAGGLSDRFAITVAARQQADAPAFSPGGGSFTQPVDVEMASATEGAAIHYTTDGSKPTEASPLYEGSIRLEKTTVVRAIAVKEGMFDSPVTTVTYEVNIVHEHEFGGQWISNDESHWQMCIADDGASSAKEAHVPGIWVIDKPATQSEPGSRHLSCTVCGRVLKSEVLVYSSGPAKVTLGNPGQWTFEGNFDALVKMILNGEVLQIQPSGGDRAVLRFSGSLQPIGEINRGSVKATLYAEFLETLAGKDCTLEAEFDFGGTRGIGEAAFAVEEKSAPEPGPKPDPKPDPGPDPKPDPKPDPGSDPTPDPKRDPQQDKAPTLAKSGDPIGLHVLVLLGALALVSCGAVAIAKRRK